MHMRIYYIIFWGLLSCWQQRYFGIRLSVLHLLEGYYIPRGLPGKDLVVEATIGIHIHFSGLESLRVVIILNNSMI